MEKDCISVATYFNDICRLCLNQGKLQSLKDSTVVIPITLLNFLGVQLGRQLPETICKECLNELSHIVLFIEKCEHSQNILKQIEEECKKIKSNNVVKIEISNDFGYVNEEVVDYKENDDELNTVEDYSEDVELCSEDVELNSDVKLDMEDAVVNLGNAESSMELAFTTENIYQDSECIEVATEVSVDTEFQLHTEIECNSDAESNAKAEFDGEDVEFNPKYVEGVDFTTDFIVEEDITHLTDDYLELPSPDADAKNNLVDGKKICDKCGLLVAKLGEHYKENKDCYPRNYKCEECSLYFTTSLKLKDHNVAHHWQETSIPQFMCHICSKMFKYYVNMKRHIQTHELGKRFICETCGKRYTTKVQLEDHINSHTGMKPFPCRYCGKPFSLRSARSVHQIKHKNGTLEKERKPRTRKEKVVSNDTVCNVCEKEFKHNRALKLHMFSHDENRIYKCVDCERQFKSKLLLQRHSATHNVEKPFCCTYCDKKYRLRESLNVHIRTHTGERPFHCTMCLKTFAQRSHMVYHMLLHSGEKSFECPFCLKLFTLKGNLTVHMRLHTGERPYTCHVCERGFCDSSSRKRHVITKHGIDEVPYITSIDSADINES